MRMLLVVLRDLGTSPSPFNSWLMLQGLETLHLRIRAHSDNALKIANFLTQHSHVKSVNYPLLKSNPNYSNAKQYLPDDASGLLSFVVRTYEEAKKIINKVNLFSIVANIGYSRSLIIHPASTTHQQLSCQELSQCGITDTLIRLSIGLEHIDDLIEDLNQALDDITYD